MLIGFCDKALRKIFFAQVGTFQFAQALICVTQKICFAFSLNTPIHHLSVSIGLWSFLGLFLIFVDLLWTGSGIGTGPGVIQDHYSPTMGRHRTIPLYNGHIGNGNSSHQPQYETGSKPYIKPNQVNTSSNFLGLCNCDSR